MITLPAVQQTPHNFVDQTGGADAAAGNRRETAWKTISKVNGESFTSGEVIGLKRGETWQEGLIPPSSGTKGRPISFDAYGDGAKPQLDGSITVSGWLQYLSTNTYSSSKTIEPLVVRENLTGKLVSVPWDTNIATTEPNMSAGTFTYDPVGDLLYVQASDQADPDTHTIYAGEVGRVLDLVNLGFVSFKDIDFTLGNNANSGINIGGTTNNIIWDHVEISWMAKHGMNFTGTDSGFTLINSVVHDNGSNKISNASGCSFFFSTGGAVGKPVLIAHNESYGNHSSGFSGHTVDLICEYNDIHDNGDLLVDGSGMNAHKGNSGLEGHDIIIRYNRIYNQIGGSNDGNGIQCDLDSKDVQIYGNVIYNCDGRGISTYTAHEIDIYNNTIFNNMKDSGDSHSTFAEISINGVGTDNIKIKNNIVQATEPNVYAIFLDSDGSSATLDITNNMWWSEQKDWWSHGASSGSSLATWNTQSGVGTDLYENPLYVDPFTNDFHLQAASNANNAGVDVNISNDIEGTTIPNAGGFDLGAFELRGSGAAVSPVARLDAAAVTNHAAAPVSTTYTVSAGTNRALIVCIVSENSTPTTPVVTYGGETLTLIVEETVNPGAFGLLVSILWLDETGIAAAGSTTLSLDSGGGGVNEIHAISYEDVFQTTSTTTDTDEANASTPNPLVNCDVTGALAGLIVSVAGAGQATTATWDNVVEQTDQQEGANFTGSMADLLVANARNVSCECTWASPNRQVVCATAIAKAA